MNGLATTLMGAAFTFALATQAIAQDDKTQKSPEEINREIIEGAKTAPDGTMQPETGRAKPVENWFGCKPGNTKDECDAENKKAAADGNENRTTTDDQTQKSPEEVNREIIEGAKTAPDGTVQPETGRAKPVENWFGCKPGNTKDECEAKNKQAGKDGKQTSTEDKQGSANPTRQ